MTKIEMIEYVEKYNAKFAEMCAVKGNQYRLVLLDNAYMKEHVPMNVLREGYKWMKDVVENKYNPLNNIWIQHTPSGWAFLDMHGQKDLQEVIALRDRYVSFRASIKSYPELFKKVYHRSLISKVNKKKKAKKNEK